MSEAPSVKDLYKQIRDLELRLEETLDIVVEHLANQTNKLCEIERKYEETSKS
jgi:hypothetical protein